MKKNNIHVFINVFTLLLAFASVFSLFDILHQNITRLQLDVLCLFFILVTAILVHVTKALRLYIILLGRNFSNSRYIHEYTKTSLVNILIPYKVGELYRGYCVGKMISSLVDGYIIVLFDRFVDTLALVTITTGCIIFFNEPLTNVYIFLIIFLLSVVLIYNIFFGLYQYWNHFLIFNKRSENTLKALYILKRCNDTVKNISTIVNGRFMLLYIISLVAWGIELGMFSIMRNVLGTQDISTYLSNVLAGTFSVDSMLYILISMLLFITIEIILILNARIRKKQNEINCNIR